MTPVNIAKGVLVAVGVLLFFLGIRSNQDILRYAGITLVVIAWFFRFLARPTSADNTSRSATEDPS